MLGISWWLLGHAIVRALLFLISNPLLYVGWILYALVLAKEAKQQRRSFGVRLTRVGPALWGQIWRSLVAGAALSVAMVALGVVIRPWDVWFLLGITVVLAAIRLRFSAAATTIGVMVILANIAKLWQPKGLPSSLSSFWNHVANIPVYSWLCLAALVCFAEFWLLFSAPKGTRPVLVQSKRGRTIGAMSVQLIFVVPLLALVPGTVARPEVAASWPWLGAWAGPLSLVGIPLVLGMGGMFTTVKTKRAIRFTAWSSLLSAVVIGLSATLALWHPSFAFVGGIVAFVSRELAVMFHRRWEARQEPIYVPSEQGVRLLAVVEGSLAQTIGLQAGEVITHVNQIPVHSEYDLHFAYSQNPAYAKLQVVDEQGEPRILRKAVYDGERAKLGVVSSPDGLEDECYVRTYFGLLHGLYARQENAVPDDASASESMNV